MTRVEKRSKGVCAICGSSFGSHKLGLRKSLDSLRSHPEGRGRGACDLHIAQRLHHALFVSGPCACYTRVLIRCEQKRACVEQIMPMASLPDYRLPHEQSRSRLASLRSSRGFGDTMKNLDLTGSCLDWSAMRQPELREHERLLASVASES